MSSGMKFENPTEIEEEVLLNGFSLPEITEGNVGPITQKIRSATEAYRRSGKDPMEAIYEANRRWSDPNYERREEAFPPLSQTTGFSPQMLTLCFRPFSWDLKSAIGFESSRLSDLNTDREIESGTRIETPDGFIVVNHDAPINRRSREPETVANIAFGNLPAYDALGLVTALSIPNFGGRLPSQLYKVAAQQPVMVPLYLETLEEIDPELRSTIFAGYWKGGDPVVEEEIFRNSDVILPFGKTEHIEDIRRRAKPGIGIRRGIRLKGPYVVTRHSTKWGEGLHSGDFDYDDGLLYAFDAAAFYGLACSNLKRLTVIGSPREAQRVAECLGEAMEETVSKLGTIQNQEFSIAVGADVHRWSRHLDGLDGSVIFKPERGLGYVVAYLESSQDISPLGKGVGIIVNAVDSEEEFLSRIYEGDSERKQALSTNIRDLGLLERLTEAGYTSIGFPGSIPFSEPGPHDGQVDSVDILYGNPTGARLSKIEFSEDPRYLKRRNLGRLFRYFGIGEEPTYFKKDK
ncbi:MAG: hypothetical protein GF368_03350 [Candidatus Aenigmarchaeota archaeon]|nr:hypothetical protein [Candidatus Aenigmarchaeota archaeon]